MFSLGSYWKKKLDELEQSKTNSTTKSTATSDYWGNKLTELKNEESKKNDIAPVKNVTTETSNSSGWFQKGAYADESKDNKLLKTVGGTTTDVAENAIESRAGFWEKFIDGLSMLGAAMNRGTMNQAAESEIIYNAVTRKKENAGSTLKRYQGYQDEVEKATMDFVAKDLINEEKVAKKIIDPVESWMGVDTEGADSILGDRADELVQSGVDVLARQGLSKIPVVGQGLALLSTGSSVLGGEAENAARLGASYEEALLSGMVSAGAESGSEYLFGGIKFGGKTLTENAISRIVSTVPNKFLSTLSKWGINTAGEGFEEVASGWLSAVGQKLTYQDEEKLGELFTWGDAWDNFVGGVVLGGLFEGVNIASAKKNNIDYVSGLTNNEKAVVDKVYKDAVAEEEQGGKKLSARAKTKIFDDVVEQAAKGYISTDTIEEVLGGESYKAYAEAVNKEETLQNEFNELNKLKYGDMTGEQIDRRAELKQQLEELKSNSNKDTLKAKLSDEVYGLVKDSKLAESYNEKARRGQAFEADLSQYDTKYHDTIKKAVESGYLNNTRRTHEMVDLVAKVSADKGVPFDFTNNEKIKKSSFAVDGKVVNAYVTKDGISLNVDSPKYMNTVVGHEITHILEGTELYNSLQETIIEYAKSKGDYDGRIETLTKLYEGVEGADVTAELTADLVGDYLFTDKDFIRKLSTENRNVFQKIYDEIKYLCKVATAGSREARELEKVKRAFAEAYKESGKANVKADTKYSLSAETETKYAEAVKNKDMATAQKIVEETAKKAGYTIKAYHGGDKFFTVFGKGNKTSQAPEGAHFFSSNKDVAYSYTGYKRDVNLDINSYPVYEQLTREGTFEKNRVAKGGVYSTFLKLENPYVVDFKGEYYSHKVDGRDINEIAEYARQNGYDGVIAKNIKDPGDMGDANWESKPTLAVAEDYIVFDSNRIKSAEPITYDNNGKVIPLSERFKTDTPDIRYSLSDSEGTKLSKAQQDYFKDSKMRDDNGNLKVMYHGSENAGFHIFDAKMSDDDTSFFFVDRNDVAASYSGTTETYEARTIRTAEDMNNFLAEIGYEHYKAVEKNGKFELLENNEHITTKDTAEEIYEEFCWYEGVGEGDANYKVYLNLTNPLVVDAKGRNWNNVSREFSQEIADNYNSLTAEEKAALTDLAEWEDFQMFRDEILSVLEQKSKGPVGEDQKLLESAIDKLGGNNINISNLFSIASDNFSAESIKEFAVKQMNTRDYAKKAKEQGYDGVIFNNIHDNGGYSNGSEGASTVAIAFESNQIKSVANDKPTSNADIRYSLSEDSKGRILSKEQQSYFKNAKTTDEQGKLKPFYHGTGRADRVGNVFDPNRATSGPMAFFTDNQKIADNYAKDKADTSLAYDEMYDDYYTQFRTEINGKNVSVSEAWKYLSPVKRAEIREKAKHITLDDDYANIIYDENEQYGNGGFDDYTINLHRGNILEALTDSWLESGTILGEEQMFLDVLKLVGLENVQYMNPDFRAEKTYEVYLNITNPFDTSNISKEMLEALKTAAKNTEFNEGNSADMWDKHNISPERWIERLEDDIKNGTTHTWTSIPDFVTETLKAHGYDGIFDTGGKGGGETHTVAIPFYSEQIKNVDNKTPTTDKDIRYSLSEQGAKTKKYGNFNISGEDIKLETAPIQEKAVEDIMPDDFAPITEEEANAQARESLDTLTDEDAPLEIEEEHDNLPDTAKLDEQTLKNIAKSLEDTLYLDKKEAKQIQEVVQKYSTTEFPSEAKLFKEIKEQFGEKYWEQRNNELADIKKFLRKYRINVNATPEVKIGITDYNYFRKDHFGKIRFSKDGIPIDVAYQELGQLFPGYFPDDVMTPTDQLLHIASVVDEPTNIEMHDTLDDETIQEAVDIIVDEVNKYNTTSARIDTEDMARESLEDIAPLRADQIVKKANSQDKATEQPIDTTEYREAKKLQTLEKELADNKQLRSEAISNYTNKIARLVDEYEALTDKGSRKANDIVRRVIRYERLKANIEADYSKRITGLEERIAKAKENVKTDRVAKVLVEEPSVEKEKSGVWNAFRTNWLDKGSVFEDLSLKTKNRKLQAKYNFLHYSDGIAQRLIGKGTNGVKALNDIRAEVESTGKTKEFYDYLYHKHNVDRMNLADRYADIENKPVFGDYVTSEVSQKTAEQYEAENPEFKAFAEDVYTYMNYLRNHLVEKGVISQDTADLWAEMYPHYVPIRRVGDAGLNINVALDTNKTGVNAPVKRATGGNSDILPLFDTMAMRTLQTYKAAAKNSFGVELKNTLGTTIETAKTDIDGILDSVDSHEELLQEGKNGQAPTFTVFENGERVTFEITEEMYDALKPTSKNLAKTYKLPNAISNFQRNVLTQYNPTFMLTNAAKDAQDVLLNSQHPARTYANFPQALAEMVSGKGKYYAEYLENGGEQNTYFEKDSNTFAKEKSTFRKIVGFPLDAISKANDFIEKIPRLAEYIASRKSGASVEVAMLDSARVTTNFAAGGDFTKFANRNGATFLNASVQGAMQQVRNVREAKANGLKGWVGLAAKTIVAGLPAVLLNGLLWKDDEEYEELSDYVKDNYYIVGKTENGKFIRIPKGRAVAVIQDGLEQIRNVITGDDEVDFANFFELVMNNIAPNNPLDNNIIAPIIQAATNKTWYGEDLVPTRLQDVPAAEQYDESTDSISKWLGEKTNVSPYKINYLLNQYSGGVGDVVLPMLTPEAESGDNSLGGNIIAPLKDKFTTDGVMNNQNISNFYDKVDELTVNANSSKATDEDVLKYKYINSVNADLSELYKAKREIQNDTTLTDEEKYSQVKDIQEQINSLARESLNSYENVTIDGVYAKVGDRQYRWYEPSETSDAEPGWQKITDKQLEKQDEVTSGLGISASDYWSNKEEYDYAYEYPEKYAVAKAVGGYEAFRSYSSDLYDIKADKDSSGKSISGSRKEKVFNYINELDADYGEKIILFKSEYNADDTYNYEIVEYLNSRDDISYDEMVAILKELGFTVKSDGTILW